MDNLIHEIIFLLERNQEILRELESVIEEKSDNFYAKITVDLSEA